jgi:hypothetical protein
MLMDAAVVAIVGSESAALAANELLASHKVLTVQEITALVRVIVKAEDGFRAALALTAKHRRYSAADRDRLLALMEKAGIDQDWVMELTPR